MQKKLILILGYLFVFQEVRPVEPLSVFAGTILAMAAFFKTTQGKIFGGFLLCKASQTGPGKYLVLRVQNKTKALMWQKIQKRRELMVSVVNDKVVSLQNNIYALAPKLFAFIAYKKNQPLMHTHFFKQYQTSSYEQSAVRFQELKKKLATVHSPQNSNTQEPGPALGSNSKAGAEFVQHNVYQETIVNQGKFSTFVYNNPQEVSKKQFWKGMFVGSIIGASAISYVGRKRDAQDHT